MQNTCRKMYFLEYCILNADVANVANVTNSKTFIVHVARDRKCYECIIIKLKKNKLFGINYTAVMAQLLD